MANKFRTGKLENWCKTNKMRSTVYKEVDFPLNILQPTQVFLIELIFPFSLTVGLSRLNQIKSSQGLLSGISMVRSLIICNLFSSTMRVGHVHLPFCSLTLCPQNTLVAALEKQTLTKTAGQSITHSEDHI